MIAIGGAIGTGLIIGTGKALAQAGPGSVFVSYTVVGFIDYLLMSAVGEMAAWLPTSSSFSGYAARFCDPVLGFALGCCYWFKYIIVCPNQLTADALVLQYWVDRDKVNPGVFIAVFLVTITFINYFGIRFFGEIECGGGPSGEAIGFRYWHNPGAFKEYIDTGNAGQFLGFWSCMVTAVFAFLETELVGVTVAEAQNPRKTIPRAIRLTFYRILSFYCGSVLMVGMLVPYNSEKLIFAVNKASTGAAASPFVVAAEVAGVKAVSQILKGGILIFVFSAANSDLYISSRTLYALASSGLAPKIVKRTDRRGVPIYALALSVAFSLLAFMNVSNDSKKVFSYFVNLNTIFGLLSWIAILVTHIYWCRARKAQGITNEMLPYAAPLGVWGSYGTLFMCILIALCKNFEVFTKGNWDTASFVTRYLGIPIFFVLIFSYKIVYKTKGYKPEEVDLFSGGYH
ncbi:unnamed protein product [Clonostachys chloroleuca]|uniref:Amino acid permease/ SLC12A domain-containing protein n=1 Tax=Clonostachys chloroleuca TaxID=1926264 RepID=A0AA35Q7V7_9HYPO|nr:unnamed protein product [Clonostachys chloroleuca]